ncbi:hypothetical protein ACKGJO_00890 [Gracilimonas sp. Q87]|uniref:hypothetical protein n=1 Tax=Gracilimonas sp. Q87 TaxID=3384766 RepID=UPI0039841BBF
MTEEELRLTKGIHHLVRGDLPWEESWELLSEITGSSDWIGYWETEKMLMQLYSKS